MLRFLRLSRASVVASSIFVGVLAGIACGGGGGDASPGDDGGGGGSDAGGDGPSSRSDAEAGRDGESPRPECLPYLQSGTPLSFAPTHRAVGEDPVDGLIALDPAADVSVGDYSVTKFYVNRKAGGFHLHCASSTLSIGQMFSDATGNVYLAGTYRYMLDVPGAAPDGGALEFSDSDGKRIFLAKFDSKGDLVYMQRYRGAPKLTGAALAAGGGRIWLAGTMTEPVDFGQGAVSPGAPGGSAFLVKLDLDGVALESQTFGNAATRTGRIAVRPDGGPVVALYQARPLAGMTEVGIGYASFAPASADRTIKAFQSTSDDKGAVPTAIAVSATGDIALAGRYLGSPDFGGGALPSAGTEAKPYVAKVSSVGSYIGARALPPSTDPSVGNPVLAFRSQGNLVLGAALGEPFDFGLGTVNPVMTPRAPLLLTFDPQMTLVGASTFTPACATFGVSGGVRGLATDPSGALYVVGANGVNTWISKIEP